MRATECSYLVTPASDVGLSKLRTAWNLTGQILNSLIQTQICQYILLLTKIFFSTIIDVQTLLKMELWQNSGSRLERKNLNIEFEPSNLNQVRPNTNHISIFYLQHRFWHKNLVFLLSNLIKEFPQRIAHFSKLVISIPTNSHIF